MKKEKMTSRTELLGYFHAINGRPYCNHFANMEDQKDNFNAYIDGFKSGKKDIQTIKIISNK